MACCAFAVFVLMQLFAPVFWLWERFSGKALRANNATVAWSLDIAGAQPIRSVTRPTLRARLRLGFLALVGIELIGLIALTVFALPDRPSAYARTDRQAWHEVLPDSWCGRPVSGKPPTEARDTQQRRLAQR